ncbi:hypothetical protein J1N35_001200 [Gossypium stocksii]|uniref:Uncharacterized protein n=1 Tax=Gossypium stocksii TaxID=47602 RepID=A0A9D3WH83_9ROSI|nr:hypothetical protein J1N35_001200 [Gossypium stocksii]
MNQTHSYQLIHIYKCISNLEKFKSLNQQCLSKLEHLRQSSEKTLKKYWEDTKKNLTGALPKLRSNIVLHAQVIPESLNFHVYNLEGADWEKLQREWKQSVNFFIPTELRVEEEDLKNSMDLEEVHKKYEVLIEPIDLPIEGGN